MKMRVFVILLFLSSPAAFAAGLTHSYLVGTRHASHQAVARIWGENAELPAIEKAEPYDVVAAFRADLTDEQVAALQKSPEVRYVETDVQRRAFGLPLHSAINQLRDPNAQTTPYGVQMVNAPTVWPVTRGGSINVAVLDTGIDVTHPDLQAAYAGGFNTYYGNTRYPSEPQAPIDDMGHGTHVSGTIAATDNTIGVVGVAPAVRLWAVRVLRADGKGGASGSTSNIVAGIQWVVQQKQTLGGDWIISMSLGACMSSITEENAVTNAENAGILVVAAAGNHDPTKPDQCDSSTDNSYSVTYPAAYPGVVAVAAVDATSKIADFSNSGPQVSLSAPGVGVLSTVPVGTGTLSYVTTSTGKTMASVPLSGSPLGTFSGAFVDCALGENASDFPASVAGNIAVIKRGDITFATKVKNAQAAGAAAVIIYNKDDSGLAFTLTADSADAGHVWPLTVAVSLEDGQALLAQPTATATINDKEDDYDNYAGTSMATPHVSASAALAWSLAPSMTADAVRQLLFSTAHDLGDAGFDTVYGNGLVDALAAAKQLNPAAFGPTNGFTGRFPGRRGH